MTVTAMSQDGSQVARSVRSSRPDGQSRAGGKRADPRGEPQRARRSGGARMEDGARYDPKHRPRPPVRARSALDDVALSGRRSCTDAHHDRLGDMTTGPTARPPASISLAAASGLGRAIVVTEVRVMRTVESVRRGKRWVGTAPGRTGSHRGQAALSSRTRPLGGKD